MATETVLSVRAVELGEVTHLILSADVVVVHEESNAGLTGGAPLDGR